MHPVLIEILKARREDGLRLLEEKDMEDWAEEALAGRPVPSFLAALSQGGTSIIAEIKRASPSAGPIQSGADPPTVAKEYEKGGASAISILTEPRGFSGALSDVEMVRDTVSLPLLRKDFLFSAAQVCQGRMAGASAVLAIVRFLSDEELDDFWTMSQRLGIEVLVELHDEEDLGRALQWDFPILGVNCRNLETMTVDLSVHDTMRSLLPQDRITIAESGIKDKKSFDHAKHLGYDAVLMGEAVMTHPHPANFIKTLLQA